MAEFYKDAYQSKYREETAQIHAPLSLIEKTKAAVREEEKRLAMAGAAPVVQGMPVSNVDRQKQVRVFSVRKWAYPLTAAAAILILASVSLTLRGLKSVRMSDGAMPAAMDETAESGAVYENTVESADAGYAEAVAEEPADYELAEAPAAEESFTVNGEMLEEAAAEDIMADMAEGEAEETDGLSRGDAAKLASLAEEKSMEAVEDYTMEKVAKRPARFNGSAVKIRRYEGNTFRILETASTDYQEMTAWEAYVETASKEGYVICGEAETVEDFLAAANQKLQEGE